MSRWGRALVGALLLMALAAPASAHKMKVFADVEGDTVSGYAYFSPGGRAQRVGFVVTTGDGAPVLSGTTDEQGQFSFQAGARVDYLITIDGGDGHVATTRVMAADLPEAAPTVAVPAQRQNPNAADDDGLRAFIDRSVARQIRPLREQLDAYQEKIWWHDVIGGLGYILGLGGLAFGLSSRRERRGGDAGRPGR